MSTRTPLIIEDSTETLLTYDREHLGQATAATVRIGTPAVDTPTATQTATVEDGVNGTTTAAATKGAEALVFASDPGCTPGRLYLLDGDNLRPFIVRVIETGATVQLADPLPVSVPSGGTLKGIAISHALTAEETEQPGPAVAYWTATIDGIVRKWVQKFRIWPRAFARRMSATELLELAPELRKLLPPEDKTGEETLEAAFIWLIGDLEEDGYFANRIHTPEKFNRAIVELITWRRLSAIQGRSSDNALQARDDYFNQRKRAYVNIEGWYAADEADEVPDENDDDGYWTEVTM